MKTHKETNPVVLQTIRGRERLRTGFHKNSFIERPCLNGACFFICLLKSLQYFWIRLLCMR